MPGPIIPPPMPPAIGPPIWAKATPTSRTTAVTGSATLRNRFIVSHLLPFETSSPESRAESVPMATLGEPLGQRELIRSGLRLPPGRPRQNFRSFDNRVGRRGSPRPPVGADDERLLAGGVVGPERHQELMSAAHPRVHGESSASVVERPGRMVV